MGVYFSCPGSDHDDLDKELEALKVRSISFKGEDVNTIIRTLSFKESDSESSILKSLGSGKMIIEGSLSFKGMKIDPFQVETTFSMASPPIEKEDSTRMASFKSSECNSFEEASQKPCVSDPDNLKTEVSTTTFSINDPSCKKEDSSRMSSFKSSDLNYSEEESLEPSVSDPDSPKHEAAVKLQKVYKSFRTRRQLADCAVLVEQSWWKLLDFALLRHSSVSFFDVEKPESVVSRWSRARTRAAKVGKGLSKDEKAQKLALQHWLEAIDPRHRYGHNLHLYYICWLHSESRQPFFYWLDVGDGKEVTHERCSRWKLQQQCIKYLDPKEREAYEVIMEDGRFIYKLNGQLVDTSEGNEDSKWIFVLSTSKSLYVGQKKKGKFQHSSFLAGGATSSAGRLVVEQGILKAIWPHSGHYRPTEENFQEFVSFLKENNVDLTDVKKSPAEDETCSTTSRITSFRSNSSRLFSSRDLIVSESKNIKQPDGLHHIMSNVSLKNLNETSLELEAKSCCSPAEYQVSDANLQEACASNHIHVSHVQDLFRGSDGESDEDIEINDMSKSIEFTNMTDVSEACEKQNSSRPLLGTNLERNESWESPASSKYRFHKRNLFEEKKDENQEPSDAPELILNRINSMKGSKSSQLRKQLSFKWTTGTGPRISCVRDYPSELQFRALEQVNLSPRSAGNSRVGAVCSPRITASPSSKLILKGTAS